MSRAFVTEHDGWNHCWEQSRDCPDANLRGRCERDSCRFAAEAADNGRDRREGNADSPE